MSGDTDFRAAVANWRRVMRAPEEGSGYRSTCGSAERMYASSPERRQEVEEPWAPRHAGKAFAFQELVSALPANLRLAWHVKQGFRQRPEEKTEEWINEHYSIARAALLALWLRRSR